MHKPTNKTNKEGVYTEGKVTLGPPWDFNLAMSNGGMMMGFGGSGGNSWQIESSSKSGGGWGMGGGSLIAPKWLTGMWKRSDYQSELKKRWAELRSGVWHTKVMDAYLDSMKTYLTKAADRNFKRWPNLGKSSGQGDADPEPMKYCNGSSGGSGMAMGGNNASTWDGEVEHLRTKMKERMQWMDQKLGFTEPANPVVTGPVDTEIHWPHWEKDTTQQAVIPNDSIPLIRQDDFSRLSPTNFFNVNGNLLEIQTSVGGTFALIDLNGVVLYKTRIKKGLTTLKIPAKAMNKHWIATLNGKMLNR